MKKAKSDSARRSDEKPDQERKSSAFPKWRQF